MAEYDISKTIYNALNDNWLSATEREAAADQVEYGQRAKVLDELVRQIEREDCLPLMAYSYETDLGPQIGIFEGRHYRVGRVLYKSRAATLLYSPIDRLVLIKKSKGYFTYSRQNITFDDLLIPRIVECLENNYLPNSLPKIFSESGVIVLRTKETENYLRYGMLQYNGYYAGKPKDWRQMLPIAFGDRWKSAVHHKDKLQVYIEGDWIDVIHSGSVPLDWHRNWDHLELGEKLT